MLIRTGGVYVADHPKVWDVAVLALMIDELGGQVTDFDGEDWSVESNSIIARLGLDHAHNDTLEEALRQLSFERDHAVR